MPIVKISREYLNVLTKGKCPRCLREVSHLVEIRNGVAANVWKCEGGHVFVVPIMEELNTKN
jgi:hypothetical protein